MNLQLFTRVFCRIYRRQFALEDLNIRNHIRLFSIDLDATMPPCVITCVEAEKQVLEAKVRKWLEYFTSWRPSVDADTGKLDSASVFKIRLFNATMPTFADFHKEEDDCVDWENVERDGAYPTIEQLDFINEMLSNLKAAGEAGRRLSPPGSISPSRYEKSDVAPTIVIAKELFQGYGDASALLQDDSGSDSGRGTLTPGSTPSPVKQDTRPHLLQHQASTSHPAPGPTSVPVANFDPRPFLERKLAAVAINNSIQKSLSNSISMQHV